MQTRSTRREGIQIVRDILGLGRAGRTEIRLSLDLRAKHLDRYIGWLTRRGFLTEEPPKGRETRRYRITEKGERLLKLLDGLVDIPGFQFLSQG